MLKSYALTTVARQAQFMGISPNSSQEAIIENLINMMTEQIERATGRRFKKTAVSNEVVDADGSGVIMLKQSPVISSESITLQNRDSALNEDSWTNVDTKNYLVDYAGGVIKGMGTINFLKGRGSFRVSYTAGYDFDNSATFLSDTEGAPIEYACWKLVAHAYNRRRGSQGVSSERIGDYSVSFREAVSMDQEVADILDQFSRVEVGGGWSPATLYI